VSDSRVPASYRGAHVLVAGGGVAALEAAFALRALAGDLVDIELLAPETVFLYRPQAVFEPFGGRQAQAFELAELAGALGAQLTLGELASVDPGAHVARTAGGMTVPYDALVVATGASPAAVLHDALTFRGPADGERAAAIAQSADRSPLTLAIPTRRTWPLPLYELALGLRSVTDRPIALATVEPSAGTALGEAGSCYLTSLLASRNIRLEVNVRFDRFARGVTIAAPELHAARIYGIPADDDGFIPTGRFGEVVGVDDVHAAGDVTCSEVKHGSLAAGQADTVAEVIAAGAGAPVTPAPFRPILRARIACGNDSIYVRRDLADPGDPGTVSSDPLWSPPAKIFARYLAPALAGIARRNQSPRFSWT
jgi:sulfide:quinone oxidoreductase